MRTHLRPTAASLVAATLTAVAVLLVPTTPASAHNTLKAATPARGATLSTAPKRITLEFMQKLDPAFVTIVLSDAAQRPVPTGAPTVTGAQGAVTVTGPLANGSYTVAYRVVSADGHPVQGSYRFTVADPAATASPEAGTTATTAPAAEQASPASASRNPGDGSGAAILLGGVLLLATVVAGVVLRLRRRSARSS